MSRHRTGEPADNVPAKKGGRDAVEARINCLVATSKPAPEHIQKEVNEAIDRLGAIFQVDRALVDELKAGLDVRLLTGESPDFFVYGPERRPQRMILLNYIEDGKCRIDPSALHEECAHALRSLFHPYENPMMQEFFGALGPVLALDRRMISGGPLLEIADTFLGMQRRGGHFTGIPDSLAGKLRKYLPPHILAEAESGGGNEALARGFLENGISHMIPMIVAESMADTGYLKELMAGCPLLQLPPKEIAGILTEYGKRCATDPAWKKKFRDHRMSCGYYLRPSEPPAEVRQ